MLFSCSVTSLLIFCPPSFIPNCTFRQKPLKIQSFFSRNFLRQHHTTQPVETVRDKEKLIMIQGFILHRHPSLFPRYCREAKKLGLRHLLVLLKTLGSLPFGGLKHGGLGRFGSVEGLRVCYFVKAVVEDRWWPFVKTKIPKPIQRMDLKYRSHSLKHIMVAAGREEMTNYQAERSASQNYHLIRGLKHHSDMGAITSLRPTVSIFYLSITKRQGMEFL